MLTDTPFDLKNVLINYYKLINAGLINAVKALFIVSSC